MTDPAHVPPIPLNPQGEVRRVGVELEMSGLDLLSIAKTVRDRFEGTLEHVSDYEIHVKDSTVGDCRIEVDFEYLKTLGREAQSREGITGQLQRLSAGAMAEIASLVVPVEIVSPPLEPSRICDIDAMVEDLRRQGGLGTHHSPIYAFGLHLNPEVPSFDASSILAHLQAFLCAYERLVEMENVDWSRRVTPYINPFPRSYALKLLSPDYLPYRDEQRRLFQVLVNAARDA